MTKQIQLPDSGVTATMLGEGENDTIHLSISGLDGMALSVNDVKLLFEMINTL